MKKKILFLAIFAVLIMIFTASSYGGIDPRYVRLQAHPDQELLSPPISHNGNNQDAFILIIIPNLNSFSLSICVRNSFPVGKIDIQKGEIKIYKPELYNGKKHERLSY
jgi:hypothetical protein